MGSRSGVPRRRQIHGDGGGAALKVGGYRVFGMKRLKQRRSQIKGLAPEGLDPEPHGRHIPERRRQSGSLANICVGARKSQPGWGG